jgi:hypothetical protein
MRTTREQSLSKGHHKKLQKHQKANNRKEKLASELRLTLLFSHGINDIENLQENKYVVDKCHVS